MPGSKMKLYVTDHSPFARKARIIAEERNLSAPLDVYYLSTNRSAEDGKGIL